MISEHVNSVLYSSHPMLFTTMYCIQHCFICRPSDSSVSEDAGIEPRTVATSALAVRHSNHSDRSYPTVRYWYYSSDYTRIVQDLRIVDSHTLDSNNSSERDSHTLDSNNTFRADDSSGGAPTNRAEDAVNIYKR
jgi:hypothetical protein